MKRLCVYSVTLDPEAWVYDATCFCGWSAGTAFDEREDAVAEAQRHIAAVSGRVLSRGVGPADSVHLGPLGTAETETS